MVLPFFSGLRRTSCSCSDVRFNRVEVTVVLKLVFGSPQSRSGRESESESELSTTCSPLETILLLAAEAAEVWEGIRGGASVVIDEFGVVTAAEGLDTGSET